MMVMPGSTALYPQPVPSSRPEPAADPVTATAAEPAVGARARVGLLSIETAAIIIVEQDPAAPTVNPTGSGGRGLNDEDLSQPNVHRSGPIAADHAGTASTGSGLNDMVREESGVGDTVARVTKPVGSRGKRAGVAGATIKDFAVGKAPVDTGAPGGATARVTRSADRYGYIGDIFRAADTSVDAAEILYGRSRKT